MPEVSIIRDEDFVFSSTDGSRILRCERAQQILREQARGISASVAADGNINIRIEELNIIPAGFLGEIYIYRFFGGIASEVGRVTGESNTNRYFPREHNFVMTAGPNPVGYVYLILRDLTRRGEVAGALVIHINSDGSLREIS